LSEAEKNPKGNQAKNLLKAFKPHITSMESKIPYTSFSRDACLSKLIAYCRHFGPPTMFISASPADMYSKLTLAMAADDCHSIPGTTMTINIPNLSERMNILAGDPVAAAEVFHRTMDVMMKFLVGIIKINYSIGS
jgi:hypothetical protein